MDNLESIIKDLINLPNETEWVEFKTNNSNPQEIGEYISALANSACLHNKEHAYLIFGVDDKTHSVIGTNYSPKSDKIGNQEVENWLITQLSQRIDFKITELKFQDKDLAVFIIDPAENTPVMFRNEAYIRVGSYKKQLKEFPEKQRKIWLKISGSTFESGKAKSNLSSDEVLDLLDYPTYFYLTKQPLPDNKAGILQKFIEEELVNMNGSRYNITNLGAILFARNLNNFENLARKAVRVVLYKGNNRLNTIKEQVGSKGYAAGFEGLVSFINDQLPNNEEIGKAFRTENKMYPEIAIRELVANAIIHQDFMEKGTSPMVEIFDDRIEISNPGKPLIPTLRFVDHSPKSRNEKLAYLMRRMYICEERGSGIDKVIFNIELYQLPAPDFIDGDNFLRAILYSHKSLNDMDKKEKIRACYQHCCLKYVSNQQMTNQSLRERFKIDEKNYSVASRIISDTVKENMIKDYDPDNKSNRLSKYIPFWA